MRAAPGPHALQTFLGAGVRAAFTTSAANLGLRVGEDRDGVLAARRALQTWAGVPVAYARQVHGADVHTVTGPPPASPEPLEAAVATADGLVTDCAQVALAVLAADCVPVLLADASAGVVGTAHAGRRGVVAGVVPAVVASMVALGARAGRIAAVVGPAACGRCYEVPADLREQVEALVPGAAATTSWGTPALDLPGAVASQLALAGVTDVRAFGGCTIEQDRWFSHRAATGGSLPPTAARGARRAGRMAGVVRLEGQDPVGVSPRPTRPAGLA